MKFTHLLAAFFLLFTFRLTAQSNCPLPAPKNLTNVANDPTYIEYTFNPVVGATGYRVTITYPSGAPTQTFDIPNPNATSCSATVLAETRKFSIRAMQGTCPSPNVAEHITSVNIITVDLVAGYHDSRMRPTVEHCSVPGAFGAAICTLIPSPPFTDFVDHVLSFEHGSNLIRAGLTLEIIDGGTKILHVYEFVNPEGWSFTEIDGKVVTITHNTGINTVVGVQVEASNNSIILNPIFGQSEEISNVKIMRVESAFKMAPREDIEDQNFNTNTVFVSPNPFNDNLTFTMEAPETGNVSVQLYNLTGGLQKSLKITPAELTNNTYTIPTADLATGMYIMQASTEQGVRHTSKVFKL